MKEECLVQTRLVQIGKKRINLDEKLNLLVILIGW